MKVTTCQCRKCGKIHAFERFNVRDTHVCECGERIGRWEQRMYDCETEEPNAPYVYKKPFFGNGSSVCKDNESKASRGLTKKPGLVMIDNNGKVNVVPVISIDSKMIVFRTVTPYRPVDRDALAKEYTYKLGIKCEVIDARTELAAVIDG